MSNSPQNKPAANNSSQPDIEFTTSNIGRWASKQENPFAEQNRKTAAKKRARAEKRQKARPIAVIAVSAVAIAAAIWGLVVLIIHLINRPVELDPETYTPEIAGGTMEDVNDYREILQSFYNERKKTTINNESNDSNSGNATQEEQDKLYQDIDKVVQNTLNSSSGKEHTNAVILAQITFCAANGCYQQGIDAAQQINADQLTQEQRSIYYNVLANCYLWSGDEDKAEEYFNMSSYESEDENNAQDE